MIEAKTQWSKAFWAALIVISLSMTFMSLSKAINNFIAETSHIVAEHKEIDDMMYPPLKACLTHWMYWVNFSAADEMNFTKEEVLYAVSYLQTAYSQEHFDIDQVEKHFFEKIAAKNMTIEQFYVSIAFRRRNILKTLDGDAPEYDLVIQNYQFDPSWPPYYVLCYKFSEDQLKLSIQKMFLSRDAANSLIEKVIFILFFSSMTATDDELLSWLTEAEYNITLDSETMNPLCYMFNGYSKNAEVIRATQSKFVEISAVVRYWKNTDEVPCRDNVDWIDGNVTCFEECRKKIFVEDTKFFTHGQKIYFHDSKSGPEDWKKYERNFDLSRIRSSYVERKNENGVTYESCINNCKQEAGCNVWSYSVNLMQIPSFEKRNLMIVYPSNVEVMKEVNPQTWEKFIADVGGLLGIWTGASILTILQLLYLLCSQNRVGSVG